MNVTDDRRLTDGWATANTEREREFTFAKKDWSFGYLATYQTIFAVLSLQMRRNGYLWASSQNSNIIIPFPELNFLTGSHIFSIRGQFQLIILRVKW